MELTPGQTLSHYRIVEKIGEGGMGLVYRATDLRLEREVAVKVLPAGVLADETARARFRQEALNLSRLSHPNIAVIHDFDSADGIEFLVMELLQGETLTARLQKGPLPLEQMLRHAIEIADALDKAHRHGIVHRDLKPGNVMLTPNGAKLLDFGLAKLRGPEAGAAGLSTLATGARNLTAEGSIVGTFQYMAPEQLEGKPADARTDIFALGAVLYEMFAGRKAFEGQSHAGLIASIMGGDPPALSTFQPMTPPALERLVKTCLAKDPERRWQTAHDVKLQLQWIAEGGSQAGLPAPVMARRKGRERWAWLVAAALAVTCVTLAIQAWTRTPSPPRTVRSYILPPEGTRFDHARDRAGGLTVSPDGRYVTFSARTSTGDESLWIQPLDSLTARPLANTKGATWPFWSPDSRSIAFFADGKLKRTDLLGSPALALCDASAGRSGAWNEDGVILFAASSTSPIHRVPAAGGHAEPVTRLDEDNGETTHRWVTFLPDGRHFLYLAGTHSAGTKSEVNAIYLGELGSDKRTLLLRARSNVIYASNHLVYVRDRILLAQPFDPGQLAFSGDPVPIAESVDYDVGFFRATFAASEGGVLAYQAGGKDPSLRLAWVDRSGKELGQLAEPGEYGDIRISPDAKKVAVTLADKDSGTADLWIIDTLRGVKTRLTFGASNELRPVWSPDGDRVAYAVRAKIDDIYVSPSVGGKSELLVQSDGDKRPTDWSRDGLLVFDRQDSTGKTKWDIWVKPLAGGGEPYPVVATEFSESGGSISPDGRWMLYLSDESGRDEVYVTQFPGPGGKWQLSTNGAVVAGWSKGGSEVLYVSSDFTLTSVIVRPKAASFEADAPRPLFRAAGSVSGDLTADGERALLVLSPDDVGSFPVTLITNWAAGLAQLDDR